MTHITHPAGTTTPVGWMEYAATSEVATTVHTTIDSRTVVIYGPTTPRKVRLALLYSSEAASHAAELLHLKPGVFTITEDGRATHSMRYVVAGSVARELDPTTANTWVVYVDAQEVTA